MEKSDTQTESLSMVLEYKVETSETEQNSLWDNKGLMRDEEDVHQE